MATELACSIRNYIIYKFCVKSRLASARFVVKKGAFVKTIRKFLRYSKKDCSKNQNFWQIYEI